MKKVLIIDDRLDCAPELCVNYIADIVSRSGETGHGLRAEPKVSITLEAGFSRINDTDTFFSMENIKGWLEKYSHIFIPHDLAKDIRCLAKKFNEGIKELKASGIARRLIATVLRYDHFLIEKELSIEKTLGRMYKQFDRTGDLTERAYRNECGLIYTMLGSDVERFDVLDNRYVNRKRFYPELKKPDRLNAVFVGYRNTPQYLADAVVWYVNRYRDSHVTLRTMLNAGNTFIKIHATSVIPLKNRSKFDVINEDPNDSNLFSDVAMNADIVFYDPKELSKTDVERLFPTTHIFYMEDCIWRCRRRRVDDPRIMTLERYDEDVPVVHDCIGEFPLVPNRKMLFNELRHVIYVEKGIPLAKVEILAKKYVEHKCESNLMGRRDSIDDHIAPDGYVFAHFLENCKIDDADSIHIVLRRLESDSVFMPSDSIFVRATDTDVNRCDASHPGILKPCEVVFDEVASFLETQDDRYTITPIPDVHAVSSLERTYGRPSSSSEREYVISLKSTIPAEIPPDAPVPTFHRMEEMERLKKEKEAKDLAVQEEKMASEKPKECNVCIHSSNPEDVMIGNPVLFSSMRSVTAKLARRDALGRVLKYQGDVASILINAGILKSKKRDDGSTKLKLNRKYVPDVVGVDCIGNALMKISISTVGNDLMFWETAYEDVKMGYEAYSDLGEHDRILNMNPLHKLLEEEENRRPEEAAPMIAFISRFWRLLKKYNIMEYVPNKKDPNCNKKKFTKYIPSPQQLLQFGREMRALSEKFKTLVTSNGGDENNDSN